ncbi:MAG TPA: hypothetical protein VI977_02295 [archaeon]|nr:hypothetical protein [archaeon]
MNSEKIIVAMLIFALIGAGLLAVFSFTGFFSFGLQNNPENFQKLSSQQDPDDICAVPAGADPVQWKEHLGHHPDIYAKCLT